MRERGEDPDGFRLIGSLLRYSERGQGYVQFVRQIMRERDKAVGPLWPSGAIDGAANATVINLPDRAIKAPTLLLDAAQ